MKRTIYTRIIQSKDGNCFRLNIKNKDRNRLKLNHLQNIKVYMPEIKERFMSKITASSKRTHWRIHIPVFLARKNKLCGRTDIKIILIM